MSDFVDLGGERYLRVDVVARWYHVEVAFLEEASAFDLLDLERAQDRGVMVAERELDRLAELLRWRWQTGLDLAAIALLLPRR